MAIKYLKLLYEVKRKVYDSANKFTFHHDPFVKTNIQCFMCVSQFYLKKFKDTLIKYIKNRF